MAKLSNKSCSGTSFHHVTVSTTVNELTKALGEAQCIGNSGDDKVNFDWTCETSDGRVFTIYDWKEYRPIGLDEVIEFHIGARDWKTSADALEELEALL
jgi:hypothetical protein